MAGRTTDTRQVLLYLSERCLINHHPLQHLLRLPEKKKKFHAGRYQQASSALWCQTLGLPAWGCPANIPLQVDTA